MPLVSYNVLLDAGTERRVLEVRSRLRAVGVPAVGPDRYHPHITLVAFETGERSVDAFTEALPELVRGRARFSMLLGALGIFPERGVLFLAPVPTLALLALHSAAVQRFDAPAWPPLHEDFLAPGRWVPHVTLATRLLPTELAMGVAECVPAWEPIEGAVVGIGLRVHPGTSDHAAASLDA
jgi:2'-5' RNA ligase